MLITAKDVQLAVAAYFGLTRDAILDPNQSRAFARPRQIAYYLARELTDLSLPGIARAFCRDHTTVWAGIERIKTLAGRNQHVRDAVKECRELVLSQVTV